MTPTPISSEEELFARASELRPDLRSAFLDVACAGNPETRARVEALLRADDEARSFLESPPSPDLAQNLTQQASRLADAAVGDRIGRYKLLQKIGEGGCGIVYMAEQEEPVRRRVALKVIKLGMDTKQVIARFEAERQALALMEHPNIARVLDAGATETGRPFFVMELVRGVKLTDYCDQHNLSTTARLELFTQVCHAVQHAHQKGIIHRDIKPSNILVTLHDGKPVPKVIDFGIAKATQGRLTDATLFTAFEQFIGTPAYMSPEQAELSGLDIDTRSDIYSLGVLLYELLTGRPPFDPKTLVQAGLDEIRRIIREVDPPRPSTRLNTLTQVDRETVARQRAIGPGQLSTLLRGDLDWIVMRCLEKDRSRRYEHADALTRDVVRHLRNEPIAAHPPSVAYRLQKFARRNRSFVTGAFAVVLASAAGLLTARYLPLEPSSPTGECHLFRTEIDPQTGAVAGQPVQITTTSIVRRDPPSVSPDGKQIAFWRYDGRENTLAAMPAVGGKPRTVSTVHGQGQIAWLGAEALLVEEISEERTAPTTLSTVSLHTGSVVPLVRADIGRSGFDWQWVPARGEIVYLSREIGPQGRTMKAYALADGSTRKIAVLENLTGFRFSFRVSPDGQWIAYGIWANQGGTRVTEMRMMSIDGRQQKVLVPAPTRAQENWRPSGLPYGWSPSGKFLLFDQFPGGINVFEVATGRAWAVPGAQDAGDHEWGLATWSPTGTFLVINRYRIR